MTISKRDFMIGAASAGGGLLLGRANAAAQMRRRVIDAHTHWYPAEWVELVQKEGEAAGARLGRTERGAITFSAAGIGAAFSSNYIDLDSRIKSMDETGIDTQVLSLMAPMVYWAPPAFGLRLSEVFNDACSAAHRKHPERFFGLAMLPMQEPKLALEELERAGKLPGLRGVMMATAVMGKNLDEKAFFPIYAKCEELGWPIFTHPVAPLGGDRMSKYYLSNLLGNPVEIGIAGYSLILGGVLDAFPKLEVMLPRAGGNVPWGIMRLDRHRRADAAASAGEAPGDRLSQALLLRLHHRKPGDRHRSDPARRRRPRAVRHRLPLPHARRAPDRVHQESRTGPGRPRGDPRRQRRARLQAVMLAGRTTAVPPPAGIATRQIAPRSAAVR